MAELSAHPGEQHERDRTIAYNLAMIAAVLVLAGIGLAYAIDALARHERALPPVTTDSPAVSTAIADTTLEIPGNWFRRDEQKTQGFAGRIDLRIVVPLGRHGAPAPVDITLTPRSRVRTSAQLLDNVYLHLFRTRQEEGPIGLIGKPLKETQGYDHETVWYDPLSIDPFVAKCQTSVAGDQPAECLRTIALNDAVAATYSFGASLLDNWRDFDHEVTARLKSTIRP